jgi:AcrR family transcriptional regulator
LTKALVDETRSPTTSMLGASSTIAAADTRATFPTAPAATPTREPPRTKRGERTRQRLITAARAVFEREGYADARLSDITTEAGTAAGSFYTYFTDKEAVLAAVLEEVKEEMLHPHVEQVGHADTPATVIEASNRAYLTSYQHNAKLMRLLDEVANVDDQFHKLRQRRSTAFVKRNARSIRDLQDRGLADPALDPLLGSSALSTMVARMAYITFVAGDPWDFEDLVATLTRLWVNALRIPTD